MTSVERDLFCNTKPNYIRCTLKNWTQDILFNKESELLTRLQDKGNRFAIVDEETDKITTQQQIAMSSFEEFNDDPTKEHI